MFDLTDPRALTLINPWAFAITNLGKRIENRVWEPPSYVDTVLIHAGKRWDREANDFIEGIGVDRVVRATVPAGAIVAVARIGSVCAKTVGNPLFRCACGEWAAAGQYHWQLDDNVFVLPEPVACGGSLSLWRPTPDVLDAVRKQVQ